MKLHTISVLALLGLLMAGCNSVGNLGYRTIQIKGSPIGIQFVPRQIDRTLEDLGYQRQEVREYIPGYGDTEDSVSVAETGMLIESSVDYRMVFKANDLPDLLVSVRILKRSGSINIGLREGGSKQLSPAGLRKRDAIAAKLGNLYGPENVKVRE